MLRETIDRSRGPLVTVITPVYNGAEYLAECIDSVVTQRYQNWVYIIVNNCSTDKSLAIATQYAVRDPRVIIHNSSTCRRAVDNWNYALTLMPRESKYCKIVHADDWLFPECLAKMVELAEAHRTISVVTSYRLIGSSVGNVGLPYSSSVIPGKDIARRFLRSELNLFGNPSAVLFRADCVRERREFYADTPEIRVGQDCQSCLDVLQNGDFGFVHQVLSFSREHEGSLTAMVLKLGTEYPEMLHLLKRYGPVFLTESEYRQCWKDAAAEYLQFLGRSVFLSRVPDFWSYHKEQLKRLGISFNRVTLAASALRGLVSTVKRSSRYIFRSGLQSPTKA